MPKRFYEIDHLEEEFFQNLSADYWFLWEYIRCKCDNAGIWIVNLKFAEAYLDGKLRSKLDYDTALKEIWGRDRSNRRWQEVVSDFI